jgi:HAD superfamily hydrolase (TIGR01490 family)
MPAAPIVAFFDLDGTLVIGQTQALLVKFLHSAGVVGRAFLLATAVWFLAYKAGLVRVTQQSREKGALMLRGLSEAEVARLMDRFSSEVMVPRLHPAAASALAGHLSEGDKVVVLSAALGPVVKALCQRLDVDDYAGAPCEVEVGLNGGRYTGHLSGPTPYGDEKARVAAGFMERWRADPADCWAYADHDTDLALLRSVGHPVAVKPRPGLLAVARQAGWPILP